MTLPLLLIGHGSRDDDGQAAFHEFARRLAERRPERPLVPCFLELAEPGIQAAVDDCVRHGRREMTALPLLLFAARHNKFDVVNELDRAAARHPGIRFHYGRPLGIELSILNLVRRKLAQAVGDAPATTSVLLVGRGASDPDANGEVCKLARLLWEGSHLLDVSTCFIGITFPRLEEGLARAALLKPAKLVVLPYFLFTGALVKKIERITREFAATAPFPIEIVPELGCEPELIDLALLREQEAAADRVVMNCEMCKFRLAAGNGDAHGHSHAHDHSHGHEHAPPADTPQAYHARIWKAP
jgi:sirohydrochlorin cobaltochelatase